MVEGGDFRYFYTLKLHFDRLIRFPGGVDSTACDRQEAARLLARRSNRSKPVARCLRFQSSGIDPVIARPVQAQHDYSWRDVRFGERFVEIYTQSGRGQLTVDYGRLHETEAAE